MQQCHVIIRMQWFVTSHAVAWDISCIWHCNSFHEERRRYREHEQFPDLLTMKIIISTIANFIFLIHFFNILRFNKWCLFFFSFLMNNNLIYFLNVLFWIFLSFLSFLFSLSIFYIYFLPVYHIEKLISAEKYKTNHAVFLHFYFYLFSNYYFSITNIQKISPTFFSLFYKFHCYSNYQRFAHI